MDSTLAALRREYRMARLDERDADPDPIRMFAQWLDAAVRSAVAEPNAMTLATVAADGRPAARIMLLKGFDAAGFVFYTNYQSRKGRELAANPRAALVFWWPELERQIRVEGHVHATSAEEADAYFASRPWYSQVGAHASAQSETIDNRDVLEKAALAIAARYAGKPIPRPAHWGGYRLVPTVMEFWQGRESRLHDRLRYTRAENRWTSCRLSP